MEEKQILIYITLGQISKLESSLGVDLEISLPGLTEEQQITELLTSLCDTFQLYPRGLYTKN